MPTRYRGTPEEETSLNAYVALLRAADSVVGRLAPALEAHGLTLTQLGVLEALLHLGPMCQRELGRKLLRSPGNVTLVLDNLTKRGLVSRVRDTADRRFVTVALTDAGRALIVEAFPAHLAGIVREMSVLGPAERESLRRLCRTVGTGSPRPGGEKP
jgi:MarR family 2-MHQ and catechol resistance regulon transcriptional repressor